jgi:hypothetical protein
MKVTGFKVIEPIAFIFNGFICFAMVANTILV